MAVISFLWLVRLQLLESYHCFDLTASHFTLTTDTIQSIEVVDPTWHKLAESHAKQDWLEMLSIIDDEEYEEYPKEETIARITDDLINRNFTIEPRPNKPTWSLVVSCRTHQTEKKGPCAKDSINKWNKSPIGLLPRRSQIGQTNACISWRIFYTKWYISHARDSIDSFAGKEQGKPYVKDIDDATAERYEEWLRTN